MNLALFPDDILNEIVLRLSVDDILKLAENNDYFYHRYCLNVDRYIWKVLYKRDISEIQLPKENYAFHYLSIISELKDMPLKSWKFYHRKQPIIPIRNPRKIPRLKKYADTNFEYDRYKEKAMIYFQYGILCGYEKIVERVLRKTTFDQDIMESAFIDAIWASHLHIVKILRPYCSYLAIVSSLQYAAYRHVDIQIPIYLLHQIYDIREHPHFLIQLLERTMTCRNVSLFQYLLHQKSIDISPEHLEYFKSNLNTAGYDKKFYVLFDIYRAQYRIRVKADEYDV